MSYNRAFAKAVAILDMVICSIAMLGIIILAIGIVTGFGVSVTKAVNLHQTTQFSGSDHHAAAGVIWVLCAVVVLCAALIAIQMWAAIRLSSATEIGRRPVDALRLASTWRTVSIVYFVLGIIGLVVGRTYIVSGISLFLRGVMIYIVFRYMGELETIITSVPVSVTAQK